jgi:regulator of protease activity HflC (stomatin/prohibitin superfamily)
MAKLPSWRLLRAPGSYLFTNAVIFLLLAAELACEQYNSHLLTTILAYLLPVFMLLIGAEALLNFVLDLYRPRIPGAEQRFSYDSRLLSLVANPESIGHSIAEALNYQFGFEVSSTWFYKLLQRSLVPLILSGTAIIWLLSCVVIVEQGQQVMVLRWGQPYPQRMLTARAIPFLIWPWPVEGIRRFNTGALHEIQLGVGEFRDASKDIQRRTALWSEEHGARQELDTLVAMPSRRTSSTAPASQPASDRVTARKDSDALQPATQPAGQEPASQPGGTRLGNEPPPYFFIKLVVAVQYRITDPYKFHYAYTDAARYLQDLAYREMVKYAASATLDEPLPPGQAKDRPAGIMSFGRSAMTEELKRRIALAARQAARGEGLGVEIARVQLLACHPPKDAAEAFESVAAAEREHEQRLFAARTEANKILAECVGDPDLAWALDQALNFRADLEVLMSCPDPKASTGELLKTAQDQAAKLRGEIEKERLLGRLATGRQTSSQELLGRQLRHIELLKAVQAGVAGVKLPAELASVEQRVEELFSQAQGSAAVEVAAARAERWTTEFRERARAENFDVELQFYRAAPSLYRLEKYLQALAEGVKDVRKIVLGVERDRVELRLNLEQKGQSWQSVLPSSK